MPVPTGQDRSADTTADRRTLWVAVAIGLVLGVFSVLADGVLPWRVLTTLGNILSPWVLAAFAAGRSARSVRAGAAAGTTTLVLGVATYYVGRTLLAGVVHGPELEALRALPVVWLLAALVIGPVMGGAGAASTRRRPPVLLVLAPAVALLAEACFLFLDRRPWLWALPQELYRLADAGVFVLMVAGALWLPYRLLPAGRRRSTAYLVLLAGAVLGVAAIRLLYGVLRALA